MNAEKKGEIIMAAFVVAALAGGVVSIPIALWHKVSMERRKMAILEKCADQYPDRIERIIDKFMKS